MSSGKNEELCNWFGSSLMGALAILLIIRSRWLSSLLLFFLLGTAGDKIGGGGSVESDTSSNISFTSAKSPSIDDSGVVPYRQHIGFSQLFSLSVKCILNLHKIFKLKLVLFRTCNLILIRTQLRHYTISIQYYI